MGFTDTTRYRENKGRAFESLPQVDRRALFATEMIDLSAGSLVDPKELS